MEMISSLFLLISWDYKWILFPYEIRKQIRRYSHVEFHFFCSLNNFYSIETDYLLGMKVKTIRFYMKKSKRISTSNKDENRLNYEISFNTQKATKLRKNSDWVQANKCFLLISWATENSTIWMCDLFFNKNLKCANRSHNQFSYFPFQR